MALFHIFFENRYGSEHHLITWADDPISAIKLAGGEMNHPYPYVRNGLLRKKGAAAETIQVLTDKEYKEKHCICRGKHFLEPKGFYVYYRNEHGLVFCRILAINENKARQSFEEKFGHNNISHILAQAEFDQRNNPVAGPTPRKILFNDNFAEPYPAAAAG